MHAEIISIGDELASGQSLDTNCQWLAQRLGELGIPVVYHTTVADDLAANVRVFQQAAERADIVIATGGLGPTADDLTRQVLAEVAGVDLVQDEEALAHIRALFARRKREMPERNIVQAQFPRGSRVIPNPHGSAPGIDLELPRHNRRAARIFALPGVPAEMNEMWTATVAPILRELAGGKVIMHQRIKCFGVGESDLEAMLPDLICRGRIPSVGITVSKATITLRITATGNTATACREQMQPTIATIEQCLGDLIFGSEDDELEHAVTRLLAVRGETLSLVEWGTGGLIADWLAECAGETSVFRGGWTIRDARTAMRLLGELTPPADLRSCSPAMLARLAQCCREVYGTTYALAVGPFPAAENVASAAGVTTAGELDLQFASSAGSRHKSIPFTGHPDILKPRSAKQALNFIRLSVLQS